VRNLTVRLVQRDRPLFPEQLHLCDPFVGHLHCEALRGVLRSRLAPERAQEFDSGLAVAWPVSRWFTPFVEFRTTTPTVADDHRTQVTLVPGLNVKPFPQSTLAAGVQLPVTSAREFDYQVRVLFIKEF
jgi:hypothetical protein